MLKDKVKIPITDQFGKVSYIEQWQPHVSDLWPIKCQYILYMRSVFPERIVQSAHNALMECDDNAHSILKIHEEILTQYKKETEWFQSVFNKI